MKIRHLFLLILLLMGAGITFTYNYVAVSESTDIDMAEYNDKFKKVAYELDKLNCKEIKRDSKKLKEIANRYKCSIYVNSDEYYKADVNNSIQHQDIMFDYYNNENYMAKIVFPGNNDKIKKLYCTVRKRILIFFGTVMVVLTVLIFFLYFNYMRPFNKLQFFARQIAKGNLDMPLKIQKNNYFGAFTESFDIMREELANARHGEYEANKSKKELVAELSHDIKTPIATIKAMCEVIPFQTENEAVLQKVDVIERKADVIDALITDMFHATLEELKVLKINPCEELSTIITPMIEQMNYLGKIHISGKCPELSYICR